MPERESRAPMAIAKPKYYRNHCDGCRLGRRRSGVCARVHPRLYSSGGSATIGRYSLDAHFWNFENRTQKKSPEALAGRARRLGLQMLELEQIEQVADGRRIRRHIWQRHRRSRIEKIVAAPAADLGQAPIAFDELQNRDVVGVGV
jgi:hypothetical protein